MSKDAYRIVTHGKASRRDYSKVSGTLELPNLVEIQTNSYKWFEEEGIKEVFEEIYPIENSNRNIKLEYLGVTKKNYHGLLLSATKHPQAVDVYIGGFIW